MTWRAVGMAALGMALFGALVMALRWLDQGPGVALRATPAVDLSESALDSMLARFDFYDAHRHAEGGGIENRYSLRRDRQMVRDAATGLEWQRASSEGRLTWRAAEGYVADLNRQAFLGYRDWRLPTLEEVMSLVEPEPRPADGLYIDPLFRGEAWWLWTTDRPDVVTSWVVYLPGGHSFAYPAVDGSAYVRAVRSR